MSKQEWATVFGLFTVAGIIVWAVLGTPPTWAVMVCFFTGTFFVFPDRMQEWLQSLADFARSVKDAIPIGGA